MKNLSFKQKKLYFFEKLLSYVVAFGVENICWVNRFKDLLIKGANFEWYSSLGFGNDFYNTYLQGQFSNLSYNLFKISSSASITASSSKGFFSSFSGGDFGGGGGGSW